MRSSPTITPIESPWRPPSVISIADGRVLAGVTARARTTAALESFKDQGERCGWCAHPIRLIGSSISVDVATGEIVRSYSTNDEPDGVLLKACGTRRATRCPSCATTYAADARMLVRAGMAGGKGLPATVAHHPMVFATFTAPSFGVVHGTRLNVRQVCRAGNGQSTCPHGRAQTCWTRHRDGDTALGEPLCPDCYDYERSVLWNATCPELWRRTTIYIRRELARQLNVRVKQLDSEIRLSFAKVAEFQRRGVVHLHAVIRLDDRDDEVLSSENTVTTSMLTAAIHAAVVKVSAPMPRGLADEPLGLARWGEQFDVRVIANLEDASQMEESNNVRSSRAVANYVAKYATKSTDDAGALDQRLSSLDDLDIRGVDGHLRRMVETAWNLGALPHLVRVRAWAHSLGFGGHWLTKSRHYSVTFGHLRGERQTWQIERTARATIQTSTTISLGRWKWIGAGWRTAGDEWLASMERATRNLSRVLSREAMCIEQRGDAVRNRNPNWSDGLSRDDVVMAPFAWEQR